ncbi:flagellar biosynthesis anti-sigma factor FlgM [Paenibacillus xylanexedens]|uniref:flagellar biosynthesis anti-sigma factor FlgM n=1 Tax=Paenibacillus xylanexedens TaxID=528191 RepID=UPI00119CC138|nr:flagellar biosynthesis anti-sigma factor FlgM [Paenibacillus xylanexedens]
MKINETGRIGAINSYQRNVESGNQAEVKKSRRKDEVSISPEAIKMLQEQGRTQDAERMQRIQELKNQVNSGTYQVDSSKLADKLMPYFKSTNQSGDV